MLIDEHHALFIGSYGESTVLHEDLREVYVHGELMPSTRVDFFLGEFGDAEVERHSAIFTGDKEESSLSPVVDCRSSDKLVSVLEIFQVDDVVELFIVHHHERECLDVKAWHQLLTRDN